MLSFPALLHKSKGIVIIISTVVQKSEPLSLVSAHSYIHAFIYPFIQQVFTEWLLHFRHKMVIIR